MTAKEQIKKLALDLGMDLCGVASMDRFDGSPEGKHPESILPGCKSAIVIGVRLLDGATQINFRAFEEGRRDLKGIYGTYGYAMLPNFELTYVCYALSQYIEREYGEVATPCSTGPMTNGAQLSLRHAAVAAGLGEFGWMDLVLTPQFGPRNRFGVILTTLELEPDPMYDGERLCQPEKCGICAKVCPVGAINKYGEGETKCVDMGGKHYEYCNLDTNKCQLGTLGMKKALGGREDYVETDEPTLMDIIEGQQRMPVEEIGLQHHSSWHCGKCQSYCPVGNWNEKFKKRGLSKGAK